MTSPEPEAGVEPEGPPPSPPWNASTKIIVVVITLLLATLVVSRFRSLIALIVISAMLAYVLNPIIVFLNERTAVRRGVVIAVVYISLAVATLWALAALGFAAFQQVGNLIDEIPTLIEGVIGFIGEITTRREPINLGPFSVDPVTIPWDTVNDQLLGLTEPLLGQSGTVISRLATTTVRTAGNLFFVIVVSIYIANDLLQLGGYVTRFAHQPGYRHDAERLLTEFGRIWSAYLRGQLFLGLIIGLVVWAGLAILGVRFSLGLGLISGLLEFIPNLGPIISGVAAVLVALFQPENHFALPTWQYALLVLGFMILVQQLENLFLAPRVVGVALKLHPLVIVVGVFMGASLAGILGAILAAPLIATVRLLGNYAWRKMFDLDPFPDDETEVTEPANSWPAWFETAGQRLGRWWRAARDSD